MIDNETSDKMDAAAKVALDDITSRSHTEQCTFQQVAAWWKKHYLKAGHKRLAKILLGTLPKGS